MKYIFTAILFTLSFVPIRVLADIAPDPGFHDYSKCVFIDNLSDYPDYDVYATYNWRFGPSATSVQAPVDPFDGICRDTRAPFFAIKQSDQKNIVHKNDEERGDFWYALPENEKYFVPASVTGSGTDVSKEIVAGNLPDSNQAYSFVSIYHIDNLSDSTFDISFVKESRYDKNNLLLNTNESLKDDSETVTDSKTIIVVGVSLGLIILIIAWKKWKK